MNNVHTQTLREKCPYLDFFWSVYSKSGKMRSRKSPNTDTFCAVKCAMDKGKGLLSFRPTNPHLITVPDFFQF